MNGRLATLHKVSLYAVVGIGFLTILAGGTLSLLIPTFFGSAVLASWFVDESEWGDPSHTRWWNVLILGSLGYSVVQVLAFDDGVVEVGIRFVLILTVIKLLSRHRTRDEFQIYALAFLMVAAATAVNDDVSYGILFGFFVLAGTFSLALFHLKLELSEDKSNIPAWAVPFDKRYMTVLAVISVGIFVTSVVIFFGFPRIGLGYFAPQSRDGISVSGFSDNVELGSHGVIRDNPEVVIRVEFPNGKPGQFQNLHWRTITFDHYDGSGWSRTLKDDDRPVPADDGVYELDKFYGDALAERPPEEIPEKLRLYVEPLGTELLPTLWPTRKLDFQLDASEAPPGSPRAGHVRANVYGDLTHTVPSDIGVPYVIEMIARPAPEELRKIDDRIVTEHPYLEPYLQLPDNTQRIDDLAERVTAEAETTYEKAEAVESYLSTNYAYTTDLPKVDKSNPVESFLFDTKRGHCEYYASSMVLMLRSVGIPARMVNGFLGGQWNEMGGYLAVRQGDAHSWVEVFVPRYGWVQMDPTPPASPFEAANAALNWFRETYDAARMFWINSIIEYDLDTQIDYIRDAIDYFESSGDWSGDSEASESSSKDGTGGLPWRAIVLWGVLALLCLGAGFSSRKYDARFEWLRLTVNALFWSGVSTLWLALFFGFAYRAGLGGLATGIGGAAAGAATSLLGAVAGAAPPTRLFRRIERAARAAGFERRPGEPAASFLTRLSERFPNLRNELAQFRHRYLAARFGNRSFDPRTRQSLEKTVKTICREIKRSR